MTDHLKFNPAPEGEVRGSSRSAPCITEITDACDQNRRYVDITAMIRSLQRTEGSNDCFRRGIADCDQIECAWRQYCLGSAKDVLNNSNA